jgi:hypothetical protein
MFFGRFYIITLDVKGEMGYVFYCVIYNKIKYHGVKWSHI